MANFTAVEGLVAAIVGYNHLNGSIPDTDITSTMSSSNGTTIMGSIDSNSTDNLTTTLMPTDYPPSHQYKPPTLQLTDLITLPLYVLIFVLSIVGNLLVIVTLIQNKRMRTVTNVFLLNLAISDLLLTIFCMPFTIIPISLKNFVFGAFMCVSIRYLQGVAVSVSCFTLVAISLERYFAICRPLHSRQWQTLKHSYKTIAVCWLVAFIVNMPIAIYTKHTAFPQGYNVCREVWSSHDMHIAYTFFLNFVLVIFPVTIMGLSYSRISYTLWSGMKLDKQEMEEQNGHSHIYRTEDSSSNCKDGFGRTIGPSEADDHKNRNKASTKMRFNTRGIRQSNHEKSKLAKKRVIKMLFAVVVEFFICWTPLFVVQTWITVDFEHARPYLSQLIVNMFFLLSYVSTCCNPITYCFLNKNFRNGFRTAFRRCSCKAGIRARNEMPSYFQYSAARTNVSNISAYDQVNGKDESDEM